MSRQSVNAKLINDPQEIGGLPWKGVVVTIAFSAVTSLLLRNWYLLPVAIAGIAFMSGAARRDPLFFDVYRAHRLQATHYSPAPVSSVATRNKRPLGYGRYDAQ